MAFWKSHWGKLLPWFASHDAFHSDMIRSMGLPLLKTKKHA